MLGLDPLGDLRRRVLLGQIERDHRGAADLIGDSVHAVLPARNQDQFRSGLARDPLRGRLADAAGSACHECDHAGHGTAGRW